MFKNLPKIALSLIALDWVFFLGWSLVSPILAIFIIKEVGGTIAQAGIAAACLLVTQALVQLPTSYLIDKRKGETDDFIVLASGLIIAGFVAIGFSFAREVWQVYLLQIAQGFRAAFYSATWPAIFSRHLNYERTSFSWSLDSATLGLVAGGAGAMGGYLVQTLGFHLVFLFVSFLSFLSLIPLIIACPLLIKRISP